jgi:hypothetical protein
MKDTDWDGFSNPEDIRDSMSDTDTRNAMDAQVQCISGTFDDMLDADGSTEPRGS